MNQKLTLSIPADATFFAKQYAAQNDVSLSKLVADFFKTLKKSKSSKKTTLDMSKVAKEVEAMFGPSKKTKKLPKNWSYKDELGQALSAKYQGFANS